MRLSYNPFRVFDVLEESSPGVRRTRVQLRFIPGGGTLMSKERAT